MYIIKYPVSKKSYKILYIEGSLCLKNKMYL